MTVFVIHKPLPPREGRASLDLTPAAEFGHVEFIFNAGEQTSLSVGQSTRKAYALLTEKKFGPKDHLMWAGGDPCSLVIVTMLAARIAGCVNWLRWERERFPEPGKPRGGFYMPVTIYDRI